MTFCTTNGISTFLNSVDKLQCKLSAIIYTITMDARTVSPPPPVIAINPDTIVFSKNAVIFGIVLMFIIGFLGINLTFLSSEVLGFVKQNVLPVFGNLIGMFGYSTGYTIDTVSQAASDAAITSIDIADSAVQDVGDLAKNISRTIVDDETKQKLPPALLPRAVPNDPNPDNAASNIQTPQAKTSWCLISGETDTPRNCVSVEDNTKCMSGHVFPNQAMCLNPTMSAGPQ